MIWFVFEKDFFMEIILIKRIYFCVIWVGREFMKKYFCNILINGGNNIKYNWVDWEIVLKVIVIGD